MRNKFVQINLLTCGILENVLSCEIKYPCVLLESISVIIGPVPGDAECGDYTRKIFGMKERYC